MRPNMRALESALLHHQHTFAAIITPRPAQYYSLLHQGLRIPHL